MKLKYLASICMITLLGCDSNNSVPEPAVEPIGIFSLSGSVEQEERFGADTSGYIACETLVDNSVQIHLYDIDEGDEEFDLTIPRLIQFHDISDAKDNVGSPREIRGSSSEKNNALVIVDEDQYELMPGDSCTIEYSAPTTSKEIAGEIKCPILTETQDGNKTIALEGVFACDKTQKVSLEHINRK